MPSHHLDPKRLITRAAALILPGTFIVSYNPRVNNTLSLPIQALSRAPSGMCPPVTPRPSITVNTLRLSI